MLKRIAMISLGAAIVLAPLAALATHDPVTKAPHLLLARDRVGPKRQKVGR
jgi:hypothetical protein